MTVLYKNIHHDMLVSLTLEEYTLLQSLVQWVTDQTKQETTSLAPALTVIQRFLRAQTTLNRLQKTLEEGIERINEVLYYSHCSFCGNLLTKNETIFTLHETAGSVQLCRPCYKAAGSAVR